MVIYLKNVERGLSLSREYLLILLVRQGRATLPQAGRRCLRQSKSLWS